MKLIIFNTKTFFFFIFLNGLSLINLKGLDSTYYYEEKYFRILSNKYEDIVQGELWKYDEDTDGFGFIANKDFGSLILLKDWSMYNFKLIKVIFRNSCQNIVDLKCDAEMWLVHTKDNSYYPPGRRIHIDQNYLIIVVPFVKTDNNNPAIDSIFNFVNLQSVKVVGNNINSKTLNKPIKLYQIIQNQPSILFEGTFSGKNLEALFLVFSQYHFISNNDFNKLNDTYFKKTGKTATNRIESQNEEIYRNVKNEEDLKPKVTLMSYSKASFLKTILPFLILFLF